MTERGGGASSGSSAAEIDLTRFEVWSENRLVRECGR